jgi:ribosomal protein S8
MVLVKIKQNCKQSKAVLEMLKTFSFVEVIETIPKNSNSEAQLYLKRLKKAAVEMKDLSSGKAKGQTLQSFIDEL